MEKKLEEVPVIFKTENSMANSAFSDQIPMTSFPFSSIFDMPCDGEKGLLLDMLGTQDYYGPTSALFDLLQPPPPQQQPPLPPPASAVQESSEVFNTPNSSSISSSSTEAPNDDQQSKTAEEEEEDNQEKTKKM